MRTTTTTTPSPSPTQPSASHSARDPVCYSPGLRLVLRELVASFFSTRGFEAHEGPKLTSVLKLKSASLRLGDFCIVIPRYDIRRDYDHELSPSSLSLRFVIDLAALIAPQAVQSNRHRRR
ncbi:unnamed protein product [Sphagnum tenellum]